jgi:hypothetical protein
MVAKLALARVSSYLLLQNVSTPEVLEELEDIANHAPSNSSIRLSAALVLVVFYAKRLRNLDAAQFWRTEASRELKKIKFILVQRHN